ncbi:MAG: ATP phosphoribosyltransferase [Chitinophagaceae bacterium]
MLINTFGLIHLMKFCKMLSVLLSGIKTPTVLPSTQSGWSSVHGVLSEHEFWKKVGELKSVGAQDIIIIPIEKMIQ